MAGKTYSYEDIYNLEVALKRKERKIQSLEKQVHDWYKVFMALPAPIRRWALWRYSKLS